MPRCLHHAPAAEPRKIEDSCGSWVRLVFRALQLRPGPARWMFFKSGFVHVVARSKSPAFLPLSGSIGNMSTATSAMGTLRPIHDTRLISAAPRVDSLGILRLSGSIGALAQRLGVAARRRAKPDPGSDTNPLNMTWPLGTRREPASNPSV
jgi:hypothetical protein